MNSLTPRLSLAILSMVALSACSANAGMNQTPSVTGAAVEVAVSETCVAGSDPKCVLIKGENVVVPSGFERVGVNNVSAAGDQGPNTVDVTFTKDGTKVFRDLTEKAAQAGTSERLLLKIGGEVQAVVTVMQAIDNGRVQIDFSPDHSAEEAIELIQAG
ncbi:hypothetical protein ACTXJU_16460 [Glutamicibacter ardleyensis]|uniref:hypothetical protein n=1 Tax=Glutamicibacter ardleyensis TaxID=225894 RepID=UPI003FB91A7D